MDQPAARPLQILQLTDCHLHADPGRDLLGVNTEESLEAVVQALVADGRTIDLVVLTGDLVHDGSAEGYRRLARRLAPLDAPAAAIPGNHDDPAVLRRELGAAGMQVEGEVELDGWRLVLLDSHLAGSDGGRLADGELERVDRALESGRHLAFFVHHHPLPVGNRWLDRLGLENGDTLLARLRGAAGARLLAWGHVHQEWEGAQAGVKLYGTPSTCVQFAPGRDTFGTDHRPPAWRWFHLHGDGTVESRVEYLATEPVARRQNA